MTGYGKAEITVGGVQTTVEIRTVNHRYGEVSVKLPRPLLQFESEIRKRVSSRLKRGKIEVFIQREDLSGADASPVVNLALAKRYVDAFGGMQQAFGLKGDLTLSFIASQKDVVQFRAEASGDDQGGESLMSAVEWALDALDAMRLREGDALEQDLRGRRLNLATMLAMVEQRAPAVVSEYADRLRARLAQLAADCSLDPARVTQEIAIMADRCDISEEIVRFKSHVQQFDETLALQEPVGRKLDFIMQELNREVNTIGSKANDAAMAGFVVELKAELEKIREQIQNVE
jgi:uncharacterized protein (TIGR00255 family)